MYSSETLMFGKKTKAHNTITIQITTKITIETKNMKNLISKFISLYILI